MILICIILLLTDDIKEALEVADDGLAVGDLLDVLISHRLQPEADPEAEDQARVLVEVERLQLDGEDTAEAGQHVLAVMEVPDLEDVHSRPPEPDAHRQDNVSQFIFTGHIIQILTFSMAIQQIPFLILILQE